MVPLFLVSLSSFSVSKGMSKSSLISLYVFFCRFSWLQYLKKNTFKWAIYNCFERSILNSMVLNKCSSKDLSNDNVSKYQQVRAFFPPLKKEGKKRGTIYL